MSTGITNPGSYESGSGKTVDAEMASLKILALSCRQVSRARNFRNLKHSALFSES